MKRPPPWVIVTGVIWGLPILALIAFLAWEGWRAYTLMAFCKEVHVGMPLDEFLRRERHHWVNDSYLVQKMFRDYVDQTHSRELEFRSHILDPEFACYYEHDGKTITKAQILE